MTNLDKKIRDMNREILALKTAHPVASNMITFYGSFEFSPDYDFKTHKYEITYVDGSQPIMTFQAYGSRVYELLFAVPEGNKQVMYDMDASHEEGDTFTLFSTRRIVSVRKLS